MGKNNHGFILPALAAMVMIASLALAGTLEPQHYWRERRDTDAQVTRLHSTLVQFERRHHRLPCPAPLHLSRRDPLYGVEAYGCSEGGKQAGIERVVIGSIAVRIGALPARTLELGPAEGEDSWGSRLRYAVVEDMTDPFRFSNAAGAITIINPYGAILTGQAGFVVLSHGNNRIGAVAVNAGVPPTPCEDAPEAERENCDNDAVFRLVDSGEGNASGFDDRIIYGTLDIAATRMHQPCQMSITPSPVFWGEGCSAGFSASIDGGEQAITSTAPGSQGTAKIRCNDGRFEILTARCAIGGDDR